MFFKRDLTKTLLRFAKFPVIAILGPRQSGKSTLAQHTFKKHRFISLEKLDMRNFVATDPERFLKEYENEYGIIIDEFQYVPHLLSYIQVESDTKKRPGYFILTGSQNFLMNQAITQSLAGRVGILNLLPLSISEMQTAKLLSTVDKAIFNGGYPRLYADNFDPLDAYPSYIQSYIERDVRDLANVGDIRIFHKFMGLCAGRIAQELNIEDIATNCGVDQKTINRWLSILEASYIIFFLMPFHNNFNKRLTKKPKLYFHDTGIACSLLHLRSVEHIAISSLRGHLFESFIIADLHKQYYNLGHRPPLYFWRDQNDRLEVDCLVDKGIGIIPIEMKVGQTPNSDYFDSLKKWCELAKIDPADGYVIYGGDEEQSRSSGHLIGWQAAGKLIQKIEE
jgi:uncharacterized protein